MLTIILIHVQRGRAYGIRPRFYLFSSMLSAWKESHRRESDSWPLPYQGSALPLSYCGLFYSLSLLSTYFFRSGLGFLLVPLFSSGRRGSNPPPIAWKAIALPNELLPLLFTFGISWGRVDSNHRTLPRTDLQSVAIAAMRLPQYVVRLLSFLSVGLEPMKGLEPPTGWLQISYSTNWVTSALFNLSNNSFLFNRGCKNTTFPQYDKGFFLFFSKVFHNLLISF